MDIMNNEVWKDIAEFYKDNEDVVQLYEDWGDSEYLPEIFATLDAYNCDWNKEKELGSWSAEFILDILMEMEEDFPNLSHEQRMEKFDELLDERYEDFRSGHQFARVNNLAIRFHEMCEDADYIETSIAEEGEKIGFPKILKNSPEGIG